MLVDLKHDILDQLPTAIALYEVLSSASFRVAFANRAFSRASGDPDADFRGRVISVDGPSEASVHYAQRLQACLTAGAPQESEDCYDAPHGMLWFYVRYQPIRDAEGRITRIMSMADDMTVRKQRELAQQQRQAEILEQQTAMLAELSTPLLAINPTTVVMPLVGAVDTGRVQRIKDTLLSGVAESGASKVILDITGVPVVDTQVANALLQSAQAVKLLGAESVLTGIRPEVAQTLVQLGVDLRAITTRGTLQDGIAYALQHAAPTR
jgi:PAS domain S-box-containing protein